MIDGTIVVGSAGGLREVSLGQYLDPQDEEAAHERAYAWIKNLRHARVDGRPFRQRFTHRGDSLWWFSEIYLHKERAVLDIHRAIAAATALMERERPVELRVAGGSAIVRHVVPTLARLRGIRAEEAISESEWNARLRRLNRRAVGLTLAAWSSRLRMSRAAAEVSPRVGAFLHRAFWRAGGEDGSAESYVGPVLKAIEERAGPEGIRYIGVGPPVNFRARRWWRAGGGTGAEALIPVERLAPWRALRDSREIWRARQANFWALCASGDFRGASIIAGIGCWPVVREQLAGIAWLQWPWSARTMDEAAAALDTLRPSSVLTYAEAGGWGRALILEARRRGIPSAGLQHGFIYRDWLNYRHEPDEMAGASRGDAGFPAPTLTLLFDDYAARHLREHGRLPPSSLKVTGSPRLDALMAALRAVDPEDVQRTRRDIGAAAEEAVVLITTKEREARRVLPAFLAAAETVPAVRIVVKPHPAETEAAYASAVAGRHSVTIVSATAPLAPLLAASRAVVTVNSTVALDAAVAGIPALVIGLPNNLSPFVEAGVLAGVSSAPESAAELSRLLYDEGFRRRLEEVRSAFLGVNAMTSDGQAAERSADAVIALTPGRAVRQQG